MKDCKSLVVNGITYVRKDALEPSPVRIMTIIPEHIEAEVAAEVRRIEAWAGDPAFPPELTSFHIRSLANHLCRNRLQAEIVEREKQAVLLAAAKAAEAKLEEVYQADNADISTMPDVIIPLAQLRAAIAAMAL